MSNLQPRSWDQIKQIERKKMMKPIFEQVQYCRRIKLKTNQLIIKRSENKNSKVGKPTKLSCEWDNSIKGKPKTTQCLWTKQKKY